MANKRAAKRNATRRPGTAPTAPQAPVPSARMTPSEQVLRELGEDLAQLEVRRHQLVAERDDLIRDLRADGWTWDRLAEASGVSRSALIQRMKR